MSRYELESKHPNHTIVVGWDAGLETFFGQVLNPDAEDDADEIVEWLGTRRQELPTVADLVECAGRRHGVHQWAI
jgi:hypothetical protein